jgi:non-specific serine/threonine protein kinase
VSTGIERIGPYAIVEKLGEGGMGEVYLARDTRLGREVAIKMLPADVAHDPERLGRFRREALTLAALNHPNIATIHGFEETADGALALILERVHGETLGDRLKRGQPTLAEALGICAQIAEALEVAHEQGVIHRDLKPGNVMLGPRGLVKVLDFGLARTLQPGETAGPEPSADAEAPAASSAPASAGASSAPSLAGDDTHTQFGAVVGTPGYMSPEQAMGVPHDARADLFSFGCVMYECVAGVRAFPAGNDFESMAAIMYAPHDMTALPERTPPRVRDLIDRCLQKDPEGRPASIGLVRREIEDILGVRRASALRTGEEAVATPNNLPKQVSALVGREAELVACVRELERAALLTLTGVGGCGKTRLALALGDSMLESHPDGVWFADLAPLTTDERVVETVAVAAGVREEQGRTILQSLVEHLAPRRTLLVLDNCEHVISACVALVTALGQACPDLQIVATSREALNIAGETVYAVPTLAVPPADESRTAVIAASEAVQLFAARASAVRPDFGVTPENAPVVADICRRLDGIPLALELAAARVRILSVEQIREKLDDRFRLLTGGSRTALPRQQTLRATIQWSYDQLVDEEQRLMRSLAVFTGGWTLGSATAICMESGDEFEILDLLTRLADKSLVVMDRAGGASARYRFLETVREYALEQLKAAGEEAALRGRHLEYFLALAEAAEKELTGPKQAQWVATLEIEHENLLASLQWCSRIEHGDDSALRLAASISRFWSTRGHFEIGRKALLSALALGDASAPTPSRATALVRAAQMELYRGQYERTQELLEQAAAMSRAMNDQRGVARALTGLAAVAIYRMDFALAERVNQESLALYEALGQKRGMAVALLNLGFAARSCDDLARARAHYERALELLRGVGDQEYIAHALRDLAVTLLRAGEAEEARPRLAEAFRIARMIESTHVEIDLLEGCAELAHHDGKHKDALRFSVGGGHQRKGVGLARSPVEERDYLQLHSVIRESMSPNEAESVITAVQSLTLDEAAAEALRWLEDGVPPGA